jgi:hypothetical protein
MKTSIFMGALALALSAACAAFAQTPTRPCGPTATEIFHLRTECTNLGKQIRDEVHSRDPKSLTNYSAHYDLQANRCYVKTTGAGPGENSEVLLVVSTELFDAQSHDELASTLKIVRRSKDEPDEYGWIANIMGGGHTAYLQTEAFIDKQMREQ